MANRFANTANLFLTTIFYTPLIPIAPIIAMLGTFFGYMIDKWMLLRRHKQPEQLSALMPKFFANLLPYFIWLYALSNFLFIGRVENEYQIEYADTANELNDSEANIMPLVMFAIISFYIFFPVRLLINKCQSDDSVLLDDTDYNNVFLDFYTDYDRENPVTKKAGTLRMIEERMKKDAGGELTEDDKKNLEIQKSAVS
jgi:hypothetical protein